MIKGLLSAAASKARQIVEQGAQEPGEVSALRLGQRAEQLFLVTEQFVDTALDERVTVAGEGHVRAPAIGG
jgi:hypothetical protein